MLNFYYLETRLQKEDIITSVKEYKAIALRAEIAALEGFLEWAHAKAHEDFKNGTNVAREFGVEWICRVACSRNIRKALEFCGPSNVMAGIASGKKIPAEIIGGIGKEFNFNLKKGAKERLLQEYSLPPASAEKYGLENLLREKSIVAFLE